MKWEQHCNPLMTKNKVYLVHVFDEREKKTVAVYCDHEPGFTSHVMKPLDKKTISRTLF